MFDQVLAVTRRLEALGIDWVLGGSLASMIIGEARLTNDIDIAIEVGGVDPDEIAASFQDSYYVDAEMIRDAVARTSSFNLLHLASGIKVDLFVLGADVLDRRQLDRRRLVSVQDVEGGRSVAVWIGSAEDQILRKLRWYRLGGEVSDRQWRDVEAIVAVQGDRLDREDLVATAAMVGLSDLVSRLLDGS
jgi:hypothetical protein